MANIEVTPLFNPNPLSNGGTFIQGWQDYQNDNGSVSNNIFRLPGQTWIGGTNTGTWVRSARSVATVSGVFTVVLRGPLSMFAYIGLNNEAVVTYPITRYARAKYAFVSTFAGPGTAQASRANELGIVKGSNRIWSSNKDAVSVAICDTGTQILYKVSENNGATWDIWYTSVAAYVPNDVYRVDIGCLFGNQKLMVEVYPSVL